MTGGRQPLQTWGQRFSGRENSKMQRSQLRNDLRVLQHGWGLGSEFSVVGDGWRSEQGQHVKFNG